MRLILAIIILCAVARADTKITWLADVTADRAETVTGVQSGQVAAAAAHIPRTDNPHGVTAPQIGALTNEQDLAALRTYHYGSPDIVESPAEWFVFDGAGTITAFNWEAGRENVVIPWAIGGVPVTAIGYGAFQQTGIVSVIAPQTVASIGNYAFSDCSALTSVIAPQVASIGNGAFFVCIALASVHMGQNAPAEATDVFAEITPPPTVYVTDPQATSWGATWNGAPVVRPPLYGSNVTAQAFTLNGDTITEWPAVELPDGIVTNGSAADLNSLDVQGSITIGGDTTYNTWARHTYEAVYPQYPHLFAQGLVFDNANSRQLRIFHVAFDGTGGITFLTGTSTGSMVERMRIQTASGFVGIGTNAPAAQLHVVGNSLVSGTNTAAEVRSTGGYIIGPTISGKQAHIFTDGTNTFQVDVNDLTNQFATVADVTGIIAPLYESGTNITVTSTQSVYSVAVTNAGPVGIDWSGLALDGTGRAEITLRLNVTEWGGTNVTFAPALTFDRTPEILVTGVWEFAASTVDGVTTRVSQTWPECVAWTHMMMTYGSAVDTVGTLASFAGGGSTNHAYFNLPNTGLHYVRMRPKTAANGLSGAYWLVPLGLGNAAINLATAVDTNVFGNVMVDYTIALDGVIDGSTGVALVGTHTPSYSVYAWYRDCLYRLLNANERAAYAAGWRP